MNTNQGRTGADQFGASDDRLIDRLIDDELDGPQRRELLERLDRAPDGWRRCALAFLEAQAWREAIARDEKDVALVPASAGTTNVASVPHEMGRLGRSPARWSVPALAATVLLAFGLGWIARETTGRSSQFAGTTAQRPGEEVGRHAEPATDEPLGTSDAPESEPPSGLRVVGVLTWTVTQDGAEHAVSLPILEGKEIDEEWLLNQPVSVPETVLREVERSGHKLVANRRLVPIEFEDGRRAVVPVDQVEVRLAGRVYQ